MSKQKLTLADVSKNSFNVVPSGVYSYPTDLSIDGLGRITSITTQTSVLYVNSITTASSKTLSISTSTGSVVVSLFPAYGSSGYSDNTFIISGFTINAYSQVSSISVNFPAAVAGTYSNPKSITYTGFGGVVTAVSTTPPAPSVFYNSALTGLTVLQTQFETVVAPADQTLSTSTIYINMKFGAISRSQMPLYNFDIQISGAATDVGRTQVATAFVNGTVYMFGIQTCTNTTSILINGVSSPLKWVDGRTPTNFIIPPTVYNTKDAVSVYSFLLLYDGSAFSAYGSLTLYSNSYPYL